MSRLYCSANFSASLKRFLRNKVASLKIQRINKMKINEINLSGHQCFIVEFMNIILLYKISFIYIQHVF